LHRAIFIVAPCADVDPRHSASAGREQRGVPVEQALRPQWLIVVLGCIQHHFNNALDITVRGRQAANVDSKPTRD
jgi:hypothetical protein